MRVVFNGSTALGNRTGIGRYTVELLRCLRSKMPSDSLLDYPHQWVRKLRARWKGATAPEGTPQEAVQARRRRYPSPRRMLASVLRPMGHSLLWAYDRWVMRPANFDLYHEPNYTPIDCDIPTVLTIHDVSHVRHPEWHSAAHIALIERLFTKAVGRAIHFFTVSEFVRREISELFNIPPARITCTPNGIGDRFRPMERAEVLPVLSRLGLPENYLLYVGTIEPRKNVLGLMQAYVDLPAAVRARCPLVLAGQWGWRYEEIAAFFDATARHKGVIQTGFLPDEVLPALYNGARALVFPTLYEGFGIPVVEMMGCGGAVLASTAGAVAEVAGGHAELIEPDDVEGWRDAMHRVITDDDWWRQLRLGVVGHARKFTWEQTAEQTIRVYSQLTQSEQTPARSRAA